MAPKQIRKGAGGEAAAKKATTQKTRAKTSTPRKTAGKIYNPRTSKFSQKINIQHDDPFTLTPLLMTDGPLKGKYVLVLDDIKTFDLLALPAEIRVLIYRHLVEESKPIQLTTIGLTAHRVTRKYLSNTANFALARVSKQIAAEVDPIMYGDNAFEFDDFTGLNRFLDTIGSKVVHLKRISVLGYRSWIHGKGRTIFDKLLPATDLREFSIGHSGVSLQAWAHNSDDRKMTVPELIKDAKPFLENLRRAIVKRNAVESSPMSVLDVIEIVEGDGCDSCSRGFAHFCDERKFGTPKCIDVDVEAYTAKASKLVRRAIAKELGIKE